MEITGASGFLAEASADRQGARPDAAPDAALMGAPSVRTPREHRPRYAPGVSPPHLHLVVPHAPPTAPGGPSASDLGLVCVILGVALIPLAGVLGGAPFGPGETGAAAAVALLAGREAVRAAWALRRDRA